MIVILKCQICMQDVAAGPPCIMTYEFVEKMSELHKSNHKNDCAFLPHATPIESSNNNSSALSPEELATLVSKS